MAWIELHQAIWTHRKTLILATELDLDETYAAAHMIRLWTWALDNAPEGNLSGLPAKVIAYGAGWRSDPEMFVEAAVRAGWLDRNGDDLLIHDWQDYAGRLMEQRQHAAQQKRRHRELYNNKTLVQAIRDRDKNRCRYCGRVVNWRDRKGPDGATYDYINPNGPTSLENVVVACRACNAGKGQRTPEEAGYVLLPPSVEYLQKFGQNQVNIQPSSTQTVPNLTKPKGNNLLTCASPDADARTDDGQTPTVNNPGDDVEAIKVTVQPDKQLTNGRSAGQDPGGSVEAEMVTATPGEQRAKTSDGDKVDKPRAPFRSKKQEHLFNQFWNAYPKKKSKGQAERAWLKLQPDDQLVETILIAIERAKKSEEWRKENGRYIPYPATWLNAKGWEDEYTPPQTVQKNIPRAFASLMELEAEIDAQERGEPL